MVAKNSVLCEAGCSLKYIFTDVIFHILNPFRIDAANEYYDGDKDNDKENDGFLDVWQCDNENIRQK